MRNFGQFGDLAINVAVSFMYVCERNENDERKKNVENDSRYYEVVTDVHQM